MKRTIQASLALAVIAAALAAYLLITSRTPKPAPGPNDRDWRPIPIVPAGARIKQVAFVRPDFKIVLSYREDEGLWEITEPVLTVPEPHFSEMLINDLTRVKREKIIEVLPKDLAQYQLDQPSARFTITLDSGPPDLVLLLGKMNYNQSHFFAKTEDSPTVFLVPAGFKIYLDAGFDAFRAKNLFYHDPKEILGIDIKLEDPAFKAAHPFALEPSVIVQETGGRPAWVIVKPVHETADFVAMRGFFQRLVNTSAERVVDITDDNLAELGFDHPRVSVIFHCRDGSEERTIVGGPAGGEGDGYYARSSLRPEAVVISEDLVNFIANSHFRSSVPLDPARRLDFARLELEFPRQPENNLSIVSEGKGRFHFADNPQQKVLQSKLSFVLKPFRISAGIVSHFEPFALKEQNLDPPALRIKLYENNELTVDLSVGNTVSINEQAVTYCVDNLRHLDFLIVDDVLSAIPLTRTDLTATPEDLERADKIAARRLKQKEDTPP